VIAKDDMVVCNITGNDLKQSSVILPSDDDLRPIAPEMDAPRERLGKELS
jgi:hypothetical protein